MRILSSNLVLLYASLVVVLLSFSSVAHSGTKVAFTGDQGTDENARAVLTMIANEGVDLLMIQGDLGYDRNAAAQWEANLNDTLGENFPVLTGVGNHENFEWHLYHQYIKRRIDRAGKLSCSGNPGVKAHCQFDNIEIVQVSPGINEVAGVPAEDSYPEYIKDKFPGAGNKWRICSWHKNMETMQVGGKSNATGWGVYDSCLNAGAMITVAHEHSYSRTHLMSSFENQVVAHRNNDMTLEPGKSFMFVSGLGGRSIREQKRGGDWWASIYTASQGATHGALICDFERNTARCFFKAIDGSVPDQFTLRLNNGGDPNTVTDPQPNNDPRVNLEKLPAILKRTDSDEYRLIDRDANGKLGHVRIDRNCANAMGGPDLYGDWHYLVDLAPGTDSIANPCGSNTDSPTNEPEGESGYVFSRTDKNELRWIAKSSNGELGSIRIDDACASRLGSPSRSGNWFDLIAIAPAFDQIENPCGGNTASAQGSPRTSGGYLFVRTDKDEKRWIGQTSSGQNSSVRISNECVKKLGVAPVYGDWEQLLERAPALDQISSPCG